MAYATATDVANRWIRPFDDQETTVIETRLGDAELRIKARIPDLEDKIASGEIDKAVVVMVEADAVLRLIRNPEGFAQETDGGYSYALMEQVASGKLSILPEEWGLLGLTGGVFTIGVLPPMPF